MGSHCKLLRQRMPLEELRIITSEGEELFAALQSTDTVQDLKEAIDGQVGVDPEDQKLFFLGFPLQENEVKLEEFLALDKTFNLVLPQPTGIKGHVEPSMSSLTRTCF